MSIATPHACALRLPVSATGRQLNVPALGNAYLESSGGSCSSSSDTARSLSATPFTFVIGRKPPPTLGSHATLVNFSWTTPFEQSPYILSKNAMLRNLPGSSCGPGGVASEPLT